MSKDSILLMRALDFAARHHTSQRRKGEAAEPYVNHLTEVALLLAEATNGADPVLVAGGLLHDTVEDTEVERDDIAASFGDAVADLVMEVTDDKALLKVERKRLQVETAPHKSERARMIKIADKISNLRAIVASPPKNWTEERKREYLDWAQAVVAGCRGVNDRLDRQFDAAYAAGIAALDEAA